MKHAQILDKLAARGLPEAIDDDIAILMRDALISLKHEPAGPSLAERVLPPLLARWGNALADDDDLTTPLYRDKVAVALATCLHKVGLVDADLTQRAITAIDALNNSVALSEAFERQTPEIKALLLSSVQPASRAPARRETLTFCRAGDLLAIRVLGQYVGAYVHKISGFNECPELELYAPVFDQLPTPQDLQGASAAVERYKDGSLLPLVFQCDGLRHLPDPAAQFHLLAPSWAEPPVRNAELDPAPLCGSNVFKMTQATAAVVQHGVMGWQGEVG